jgi:hypothetical protein
MISYMGMKASKVQEQQKVGSSDVETFTLSTHTYQYAWLSTAAYLHGSVPVVVLMIYLFLSLFIVAYVLSGTRDDSKRSGGAGAALPLAPDSRLSRPVRTTSFKLLDGPRAEKTNETESNSIGDAALRAPPLASDVHCCASEKMLPTGISSMSWFTASRLLILIVVHAVVMICVNILYIYIILTGLSSNSLLFLVQLALSVFKLCWNRYKVGFVVAVPLASLAAQTIRTSVAVHCSSFMVLFTFIISPVLATFFSDNTCFRYFITGQSAVDSTFQTDIYECFIVCSLECASICEYTDTDQITVAASVVPSWQYSYQCSSSLLVNYTPVLVYSFAITGLLVPLLQYLYCLLTREIIERYFSKGLIARYITNTIYAYKKPEDGSYDVSDGLRMTSAERSPRLFNGISVISRAYMNIGVLITFGLASPLLAIAISMDCINLYIVWKALIQRYLSIFVFPGVEGTSIRGGCRPVKGHGNDEAYVVSEYMERITRSTNVVPAGSAEEADAVNVSGTLGATHTAERYVLWMVVWIAGLFWGLFVFDMYGDIYGAVDGLCMILVPTIGGALVFFLAGRYRRFQRCYGISPFRFRFAGSNSQCAADDQSVKNPIFDPQGSGSVFMDNKL